MEESKIMICGKCNVELEPAKIYFSYLDHSFDTDVLRCPKCGLPFIPEELASERMAQVEMSLEDK